MGKEEDKIEKIIRGLLKLPENRRCINCNSLGPQYVCTTFWTFVCTNCSGVHREFTHRVKSVSMAKFSMEEVNSLQAGGNEKARDVFFKTWNPHRNYFPDNSNIQKLRDFIKYVYVDRRYAGENHPILLPRLRNSDKDESYERTRQDTFRERTFDRHSRYAMEEVRSPGYQRETNNKYSRCSTNDELRTPGYPRETNERHGRYSNNDEVRSPGYPRENNERHSRYSNNEVRSPGGNSRENSRYGGPRASSSRFESMDGRYQVDDARIAGRSATQMFTTEDIRPRRNSPDRYKSRGVNSPTSPVVRNVRELLGDKFESQRVGDQTRRSQVGDYGGQNSPRETFDQSKTAHRRTVSANVQKTVRLGNEIPAGNDSMKPKSGSAGSLVDFASFPPPPPPPDAAIQNQALQIQVSETPAKEEVCDAPKAPPKNTLEFLLFELSTPAQIPPSDQSGSQASENAASTTPTSNSTTLHHISAQSNHTNDHSTLQLALASTQEFPNTPIPSAASSANRFDTAYTGMPLSRHIENPNLGSPQMVPDFLGGDGVSAFEEASRQSATSNHQLDNSNTLVSHSNPAAPQISHLHENLSRQRPANLFPTSTAEVVIDNSTAQSSKPAESPAPETKSTARIQPSSGRAELPEDLFASLYPSRAMTAPRWQMSPSYGMGFNTQFYQNAPMQTPPFLNVAKSVNPFDTNDDANQHQFSMVSSAPVPQGGIPNVLAPSGISRTQSFESRIHGFQSTQSPSYQSGGYMGQYPFPNVPPCSQQEIGGFGGDGATITSLHSNQQLPYQYTAPPDPRSFSTGGGNPFG